MNIIEPYAKILPPFNQDDGLRLLRHVEWCARISHRSEEGVTHDSWRRLLKAVILDHGDWSVAEHSSVSVDAYVDRGITHEWVRHRLFAFTQECISGDTHLNPALTIKQAYEKNLIGKKIKSSDGYIIVKNCITHIFNKGIQPVYSVVTKSGYRIKTTLAHEFQIPSGEFVRLESLQAGNRVMVNGRPSLLELDNETLHKAFFDENLSPAEIADREDVPYTTITRRLRQLGIFRWRRNDKNPDKYNSNHTAASYEKMRQSVIEGYRDGRSVWNKGITEDESESVKRQGDTLRKFGHRNGNKESNSNWKGGVAKTLRIEARQKKAHITNCEVCDGINRLEVHHIDLNPRNNTDDNLIKLCYLCHRKVHSSFKLGVKPIADEIVSIIFTGWEEVFDLEMQTHHNYIANGFIVHNSTRFVNYQKKMAPGFVDPFYKTVEGGMYQDARRIWDDFIATSEQTYKALLNLGYPPQIARSVFPNALASRLIVTGNLRNWRHFFLMRTSKETHPQMRQVTIPLLQEFKEKIPLLYDDIEPGARQIDNLRKGR